MQRRNFIGTIGTVAATGLLVEPTMAGITSAVKKIGDKSPVAVAGDEGFWREIQQSFSVSRSVINLNNAGICASPRVVTNAMVDLTWEQEKLPPYTAFTTLEPRMETVRTGLSKMFGCDREEIAIVRNATEALQAILLGVPLKKGEEVLTTTHDYWAMLDALEQRERREGIIVKKVNVPLVPDSMDALVKIFEEGITPKTRLILVSHPVNQTGQMFPIKEICDMAHARGIEVVVDGAQSFGMLDYKVEDLGCDYYGTSLHKWLMGPTVTGMLYVKKEKIEKVWPLLPPPKWYDDNHNIRKFEALGTQSATPLAIGEALTFHNGIGAKRKEERFRYLTKYWVDQVSNLPNVRFYTSFEPGMSCAIANVGFDGIDPKALNKYLWDEHRLLVTSVRLDSVPGIRVSPSIQNTVEELDRFCEIMESVSRKGLPDR